MSRCPALFAGWLLAMPLPAIANPAPLFGPGVPGGGSLFAVPAPPVRPMPSPIPAPGTSASQDCRTAIAAAERAAGIPASLLAAIARVESGRTDPVTGRTDPWPWTINAEGEPGVFASKTTAIAAVRAKQAAGIASIDVGCLQVNLLHHPRAFASLEQAFDPVANAAYAARFLTDLYSQTGDWSAATARYHSATPELGAAYQRKVAAAWQLELATRPAAAPSPSPALAQATLPPGAIGGFTPLAYERPGRADGGRVIPLAAGAPPGRGLSSYRGMPVTITSRPRG